MWHMAIRVYVDNRESPSEVPEILRSLGIEVIYVSADVGDYIISERTAIERKTIKDLISSVYDGRVFQQAKKLSESYENPILIIEGDISEGKYLTNNWRAVNAALATVALNFQTIILYSMDKEETAKLIKTIAEKESSQGVYVILKRAKGRTQDEILEGVISSIPNIGPKIAKRLLMRFGSIYRIVNASLLELRSVEGLGEKRAEELYSLFRSIYSKHEKKENRKSRNLDTFIDS
jgi:DNA excision repair protein ERCC-4